MKKTMLLLLVMVILLGLAACNISKDEDSPSGPDEGEIYLETYFHGTSENEQGETTGVLALIKWYSDWVAFEMTEYSGSVGNVLYHQEGLLERPEENGEDESFTIERTKDDPGQIDISLSGNDLTYKITRGDTQEVFVLQIITEGEASELK